MKVYCVIEDAWDYDVPSYIIGIFSTREKADAVNRLVLTNVQSQEWRDANNVPDTWELRYSIREIELDSVLEKPEEV